jgi:catechol 2,3-dioxygenase-like lactoylglutathione lyase family enzyme
MKVMLRAIATACVIFASLSARPGAAATASAVDSVEITVADLDRSVSFFTEVLAFQKVSEAELTGPDFARLEGMSVARARAARLRLGREVVELTQYLAPAGRPIARNARSNDESFQHLAVVVSDMNLAFEALRRHKVEYVSTGPQRLPDWNPHAGGIRAFYFRDPDGHTIEIIQFPPGKGDPRWQRAEGRLFLGIDHTAIVCFDTDKTLRFYRDALGMRVVGESENWGSEQEHLNMVFGARLRITSLRAASGPGIELLEYLVPRDGARYPIDERASDIAHWQTKLVVDDVDAALTATGAELVSARATSSSLPKAAVKHAAVIRDPDRHAIELIER